MSCKYLSRRLLIFTSGLLASTFGRPAMSDMSFTTTVPSLIDEQYFNTSLILKIFSAQDEV
jgi:hypothetical protein